MARRPCWRALLVMAVGFAVVVSSDSLAKKPGGGNQCPRNVFCLDVWDPVICDDGQVYSNDCYAWRECATGCEPYGDGGPVVAE